MNLFQAPAVHDALQVVGLLLTLASSSYALLAWLLNARVHRSDEHVSDRPVSVSVLKPLYGFEARLEANLSSLARAAMPGVQILCGVRDFNDPAIAIVRRVQESFPHCELQLVIDPSVHGHNLKVSNLLNLYKRARGDVIVIADSDILVAEDYIRRVIAPLSDAKVGLVTCLYRGRPGQSFISRVGSLFVDTWFIPSVGVASHLGDRSFGFGATLAMRRETLELIGGLASVKDQLADDYWLGELVHRAGLRTVLSDVVVETDIAETTLRALWQREVRWMRTIRSLNPVGFSATFITHTIPMLMLGVLLNSSDLNLSIACCGLLARIALQLRAAVPALWLMPLRDGLLLLQWATSLVGRQVTWRDATLPLHTEPMSIASSPLPEEADVL